MAPFIWTVPFHFMKYTLKICVSLALAILLHAKLYSILNGGRLCALPIQKSSGIR